MILHRPASEITPYLTEGTVEPLAFDRCRLVMGAWSWAALAASIAQTDTDIDVVEPSELAQAFVELALRASAASHLVGEIDAHRVVSLAGETALFEDEIHHSEHQAAR